MEDNKKIYDLSSIDVSKGWGDAQSSTPAQPVAAPKAPGGVPWFKRSQRERNNVGEKMYKIWNGESDEDLNDILNKHSFRKAFMNHIGNFGDMDLAKKYATNYNDLYSDKTGKWDVPREKMLDLYLDFIGEAPQGTHPKTHFYNMMKELIYPDMVKEEKSQAFDRKVGNKINPSAFGYQTDSNDELREQLRKLFDVKF